MKFKYLFERCCYRPSLKMKTNTIIQILLMNLLTGGLCEPSCEGLIKMNEGNVTLQINLKEEIEEIQWIRMENHNVFFHIVNLCKFEKGCCQHHPKNCCRIENKSYENKLCSCHISSLSSSITFCNVTHKDEGSILADIHTKNNKPSSTCKFDLHIPGENYERTEPQDHTILAIAVLVPACINVVLIVGVVFVIFKGKNISCCGRRIWGRDFQECPTSPARSEVAGRDFQECPTSPARSEVAEDCV